MTGTRAKPPDSPSRGVSRDRDDGSNSLVELFIIVPIALLLALGIQAFLIKPFRIPSESMVPTLAIGQRVLVDRVSYNFSEPHRGDVVVFKAPRGAESNSCGAPDVSGRACTQPTEQQSDENFIKRVVGEPGDRLKVLEGRVYINGRRQAEPFIRPDATCDICDLPREITIPPDHFFMMGDNRGQSADSREWGPVPKDWIVGNAFFTYWPPGRVGIL
jgi:signal peptidase I